jgi:hypothetical protein
LIILGKIEGIWDSLCFIQYEGFYHQDEGETEMNMKKISAILAIAAVCVLLSAPVFAEGPERFVGNPLPGVGLPGIPGGVNGSPAWDNGTRLLVGALIGGLIVYTIENSRRYDQDRYDADRYGGRQRDRVRDYRRHDPKRDGHFDRDDSRYDRDHRYDTSPWDRESNRYPQRYPR